MRPRSSLFRPLAALLGMLTVTPAVSAASRSAAGVYDVRDFGARGDGKALDTAAINRAMDAAASAGGGTVRLPAGEYRSTSVHLRSNVTLEIGAGATLIAAAPGNGVGYDPAEPNPAGGHYQDFGHSHWHNSLIWGEGLHDVAIVGPGQIFGQGLARDSSPDGKDQSGIGNKSIALKLCRNVILRDITIRHGGWFGLLATGVDNLTVDGLKIDTNRDGMDLDCCRNVRVSDCTVNSPHDDGICLKSSYGLGFLRPTENVTITNCQVSGFDEGTLLDGTFQGRGGTGRIKFGTESNGGFKNITISNCVFDHCLGLALEEVDGGALEDVSVSNLTLRDIGNAPIFLRLGGRLRGPAGTAMGALRRVGISHVDVYDAAPASSVIVAGVPDGRIEDVAMSDIRLWFRGGGTPAQAARVPPEDEKGYPEPGSLGVMPAYGFFLRHVRGISLDHVQVHSLTDDRRPAFVLNDVGGADFAQVNAQHPAGVPVFALESVSDLALHQVRGVADTMRERVEAGTM